MQQKRNKDTELLGNTIFWVPWNTIEFKFFFFILLVLSLLKVETKVQRGWIFFFFSRQLLLTGALVFRSASKGSPDVTPIWPCPWQGLGTRHKIPPPKNFIAARHLPSALLGKSAQEENVCWKIHGARSPLQRGGFGTGTRNVPKHPAMESVLNSKCSISALSPHEL